MKPDWQVERARQLAAMGRNNCEIGREIGVNRRTVSDWVRSRTRRIGAEGQLRRRSDCTHWPHLFPQHGPGVKHERPIVLEPWQLRIVERYPGRLLRGLIHSDGCRVVNRIRHPKKTYAYPRYFFSNRSDDIRRIFCDACDRLGIEWRQDGPWNVSVARHAAVAELDRHVGPKR